METRRDNLIYAQVRAAPVPLLELLAEDRGPLPDGLAHDPVRVQHARRQLEARVAIGVVVPEEEGPRDAAERLGVELPEAAGAPADAAPPEPPKSEAAEPPRPPALDELKAWADERLTAARQLSPAALGGELKAWATELGSKMEAKIDEIRRKESKS